MNTVAHTQRKTKGNKQTKKTITTTIKTGRGQKEHGSVPGIYVLSQRIFFYINTLI